MPDSAMSALSAAHFISFESPAATADDDGWTDFFAGATISPSPIPSPAIPRAALPLSIFGLEEPDEPPLSSTNFFPSFGAKKGNGSCGDVGNLVDIVKNLYGSTDLKDGGGGEGFEEENWEFQDAVENDGGAKVDFGVVGKNSNGDSGTSNQKDEEEEEDFWEFQDACGDNEVVSNPGANEETSGTDEHLLPDHHQPETRNIFVDFYYKLKDGSTFLVHSYINDLKDAQEAAALSGATGMAKRINGKIEEAQKKLLEAKAVDTGNMGKYPSKDVCISQMYEALFEPNIQSLTQEYNMSKRISLAENSLEGAIELLEHSALILNTLSLASQEEQHSYIVAWSKVAAVCLHELQQGAMIWKESINEGVSAGILSQEGQYFVALGEVYRCAEILRVSVKFYKPWLLSNWGEGVELGSLLDKCAEVWLSSGLEKAFECVSRANDKQSTDVVEALHASIKVVNDLDHFLIQIHSLYNVNKICKLSLLPLTTLPEMKMVIWNGDHYYVKLANLWANRISPYPPQLPCIHV